MRGEVKSTLSVGQTQKGRKFENVSAQARKRRNG
jgi:hypothetical protein